MGLLNRKRQLVPGYIGYRCSQDVPVSGGAVAALRNVPGALRLWSHPYQQDVPRLSAMGEARFGSADRTVREAKQLVFPSRGDTSCGERVTGEPWMTHSFSLISHGQWNV
jgi:hypothetical protein